MRKVSTILRKSTCDSRIACAPCYAPERCADNEYYAEYTYDDTITPVLGGDPFHIVFPASATSCVSYNDALNKATYAAMMGGQEILTGILPMWLAWAAIWSNGEISFTAYCPCSWTGEPVTGTVAGGTVTNILTPASANWFAYQQAEEIAVTTIVCTPPE